ncbi:hypothetical protein GGI11_004454, partial [Coemansia sp. RSA 2049]
MSGDDSSHSSRSSEDGDRNVVSEFFHDEDGLDKSRLLLAGGALAAAAYGVHKYRENKEEKEEEEQKRMQQEQYQQ